MLAMEDIGKTDAGFIGLWSAGDSGNSIRLTQTALPGRQAVQLHLRKVWGSRWEPMSPSHNNFESQYLNTLAQMVLRDGHLSPGLSASSNQNCQHSYFKESHNVMNFGKRDWSPRVPAHRAAFAFTLKLKRVPSTKHQHLATGWAASSSSAAGWGIHAADKANVLALRNRFRRHAPRRRQIYPGAAFAPFCRELRWRSYPQPARSWRRHTLASNLQRPACQRLSVVPSAIDVVGFHQQSADQPMN